MADLPAPASRTPLTRALLLWLGALGALLVAAIGVITWRSSLRQLDAQLAARAGVVLSSVRFAAGATNSREEMSRLVRMLSASGDTPVLLVAGGEPLRVMLASEGHLQGRNVSELSDAEIGPGMKEALLASQRTQVHDRTRRRFRFVARIESSRGGPLKSACLYLELDTTAALQAAQAGAWRTMATLAGLVAGTGALLVLVLRRRVLVPVRALAERYAAGASSAPSWGSGLDGAGRELIALAGTLDHAFGEIAALNRDLETRVQARTTELVASLEREREAGRLKTSFIGMISHEFRNALALVLSSTQILQRHGEKLSPADRARHLRQVEASCRRLNAVVDDTLVYCRGETGRLEANLEPVDLAAFCRDAVAAAQDEVANGTPATVTFAPEGKPIALVETDETLLQHVVSNLIANAVKYSPAGGAVAVTLRVNGAKAAITVVDQGVGIPAADLAKLGEPFHRAGNVADIPGTGLGLAIVRRCLDLLGGKLEVESEEGRGTRATVTLPLRRNGASS